MELEVKRVEAYQREDGCTPEGRSSLESSDNCGGAQEIERCPRCGAQAHAGYELICLCPETA